jgi:hypothetical protein
MNTMDTEQLKHLQENLRQNLEIRLEQESKKLLTTLTRYEEMRRVFIEAEGDALCDFLADHLQFICAEKKRLQESCALLQKHLCIIYSAEDMDSENLIKSHLLSFQIAKVPRV